jgi:hypothetical protein
MMRTMTSAYLVTPRIAEERCRVCTKCLARQACRPSGHVPLKLWSHRG